MTLPQGPNHRWSLAFVSGMLADGRRFRVLVVFDDFTRERLALVVDTSLSGMRVTRELDAIAQARGRPPMIASDNGAEPASRAILRWQRDNPIKWRHIAHHCPAGMRSANAERGKRARNGFVESLNGRFRDKCLNEHLFRGMAAARRIIEEWRIDYNEQRPHMRLRGLTPNESATRSGTDHKENRVRS